MREPFEVESQMMHERMARDWLGSRCAAQPEGEVRFQVDTDEYTDSGRPCDCVSTLTSVLDKVRDESMEQCIETVRRCQVNARDATLIGKIVRELTHLQGRPRKSR